MTHYSDIAGKRILITGATSGLGLAMAQALLMEGAKVLVSGREQAKIDKVVLSFKSLSGESIGALINVRDEQSIQKAVSDMVRLWGGIDILINNAGIGMRTVNPQFLTNPKPFWEVSSTGFRDLIDTNLTGYFLVAKEVIPHFLKSKAGKIINITVNQETMRRKGFIPYGPSRAGAESLSQIMAQDLGPLGITVNMLLPGGATDTGMIPEAFPAEKRTQLLRPEVMAEPILFLCSDQSNGVNDERIIAKDFAEWKTEWLVRNKVK